MVGTSPKDFSGGSEDRHFLSESTVLQTFMALLNIVNKGVKLKILIRILHIFL